MILSVIIVNYRVPYFLELCLRSVEKAVYGMGADAEVFVVDNCSGDGSVDYLRPKFPWVRFVINEDNVGFARANNQVLAIARGRHVLFLNPDTILPEDMVTACIAFLESTPRAGGLGERAHEGATDVRRAGPGGVGAVGVRMVDGGGRFLKESRRGFPSPWVAFCKLSGLTALFPHSRLFAGYYLGHLPEGLVHNAPVLSGACLWVPRPVLDIVGGFDERFFMYAEDIDLSYRIGQAGYRNYYLPDVTIVHFKGESTRKDIRYVKLFYRAMSQFRRKHFRGGFNGLFNGLMEAGIWVRAAMSAVKRAIMGGEKDDPGLRAGGDAGPGPVRGGDASAAARAWLTGDPGSVRHLSAVLSLSGKRVLVADSGEADEIIFCEGPAYPFKEIIADLQAAAVSPGRPPSKFYAAGSGSVTGSASKDGRGETVVL
jgi:N-acetylglucosaminyl-diphospho-decaprenol L-rhamnosyltransferase